MTIVVEQDCLVAAAAAAAEPEFDFGTHKAKLDYGSTLFCHPAAVRLPNELICVPTLKSHGNLNLSRAAVRSRRSHSLRNQNAWYDSVIYQPTRAPSWSDKAIAPQKDVIIFFPKAL